MKKKNQYKYNNKKLKRNYQQMILRKETNEPNPIWWRRSAVSGAPESSNSRAMAGGSACAASEAPPAAGNNPRQTSGNAKRAWRQAIRCQIAQSKIYLNNLFVIVRCCFAICYLLFLRDQSSKPFQIHLQKRLHEQQQWQAFRHRKISTNLYWDTK